MDLQSVLSTPLLLLSSSSSSSSSRVLSYSQEFLDSGCVGDFDEADVVDDTFATYSTNYVVTAICILVVVKMMLVHLKASSSSSLSLSDTNINNNNDDEPKETTTTTTTTMKSPLQQPPNKYMIGYFFFMGLSFGIGGVYHHIVTSRDEQTYDSLRRGSLFFFGMATGCLALSTIEQVVVGVTTTTTTSCRSNYSLWWWIVAILTAAITILNVIAVDSFEFIGAFYNVVIILPFAGIVYARKACRGRQGGDDDDDDDEQKDKFRCNNIAKAMAMLIMFLGYLVIVPLYPLCGSPEAYGNCFEDCPLPFDPTRFNHNAIFHILIIIGLFVLGVAEIQNPTTKKEPSSMMMTQTTGGSTSKDESFGNDNGEKKKKKEQRQYDSNGSKIQEEEIIFESITMKDEFTESHRDDEDDLGNDASRDESKEVPEETL